VDRAFRDQKYHQNFVICGVKYLSADCEAKPHHPSPSALGYKLRSNWAARSHTTRYRVLFPYLGTEWAVRDRVNALE
jgi:hypothetical protein